MGFKIPILKKNWTNVCHIWHTIFIMRVIRTDEFEDWFDEQTVKEQAQIDARIQRIEEYDHFGDAKDLGEGLAELRWASGRRVYFTRVFDNDGLLVLLVLGGIKNGQKKDIKKARLLVQKYASSEA